MKNIRACVFDAYGTLFDVAAAAARCKDTLGDLAQPLAQIWRTKQLEYTWLRTLMDEYVEFWQVTGDGLDFAMETLGLDDAPLRQRLMDLYFELDAYPEVKGMLSALKAGGQQTAILSNATPAMLQGAVAAAGLGDLLDGVFSVESLGYYKPRPGVYQLAADGLGLAPENICFMSSNAWDANGAANFGFKVVWVNRMGLKPERLPGTPAHEIQNLSQLPGLLGL